MFTALALVNTMQPLMASMCLQYNAAGIGSISAFMAVGITGISGIAANLSGGWMLDRMPVGTLTAIGVAASLTGAVLIFATTGKRFRGDGERCGTIALREC